MRERQRRQTEERGRKWRDRGATYRRREAFETEER
jgi:hypothetical protein